VRGRGGILVVALGLALTAPSAPRAQSPGQPWRIGILSAGAGAPPGQATFLQALRERGYIEGQNLAILARYAKGSVAHLPELAAELVGAKVDVIVTVSNAATLAAKQTTATIPIVAATADNPVASGLAVSLARPGGNVTGVVTLSTELSRKRLEVLKEILPGASRVGVLTDPVSQQQVDEMQAAARNLGLHVVRLDVRTADELDRVFKGAQRERVNAVIVLASPLFASLRPPIIRLAAQYRLPALYSGRPWVEAGGLMAYGPDIDREAYLRAAILVDRVLKGARPADLPFEQVSKIDLLVNARTARALGLAFPPSILARAEVVE
jgi:putative ABC transport system substrate-binding protein